MADSWHVVSKLHGSLGSFDSRKEANDFAKDNAIPIGKSGAAFVKKNYGQRKSAARDILGDDE